MTRTSRKTTAYSANFEGHMADHDILLPDALYKDGHVPPVPDNMDEIRERMARRRNSLSPSRVSDADIQKFRPIILRATSESNVKAQVLPLIEGNLSLDDSVFTGTETRFNNFEHLTDGTLAVCKPDRWHGESRIPEVLRSAGNLAKYIVPSTQEGRPAVPNFFLEAKGPSGTLNVAERQACYDGALGARAIRRLQIAGQTPSACADLDNKAYTITCALTTGLLTFYTSHPIPARGDKAKEHVGYGMTYVNAYVLTEPADFRQGVAAYRNLRDWAAEQRRTAVEEAHKRLAPDSSAK
ncbi:hypothetical protein VFPBJ_06314 [Purpureocillium lilacinum]|uniref:Uncharacterized protein n=1 Tax=Purpureocillium lilacinum TaxID=33203 RepID=A0A179GJY8_PURLI|nr:hypothetical protein VFPBJ_06314 [Purpureocillium lilacinum]